MPLITSKMRKAVSERLVSERERLGYTQHQIAQLLGVPEETYAAQEAGRGDPGLFSLPKLHAVGFDVMFIISGERFRPVPEESELLRRFRELSLKGRSSIFMTLDALERLAPNLKSRLKAVSAKLPTSR